MFAKLCIYAFFLIAITTITIGAPLEVSSKLTSRRAQLEKYGPQNQQSLSRRGHVNFEFAQCINEDDEVLESYCIGLKTMAVLCIYPDNTVYTTTNQCEDDEVCVEYYDEHLDRSALCVETPYLRIWTSVVNKLSCSSNIAYNVKGKLDLHTGVNTYYINGGKPANVYELQTFFEDQVVEYNFYRHNITKTFSDYKNDEKVKYCFVPGTDDQIAAYAIAMKINKNTKGAPELVAPSE